MDILKINENSLKVMLSAEDMITYSISCEIIENDRAYSVAVLREILRDAGQKCGFEAENSKLFVQLYASSNGECEIFASRITNSNISLPDCKIDTKEYRINPSCSNNGMFIYSFDKMIPMTQVCNRLRTAKYMGESTAYKEKGGRMYYLVLEEKSPFPGEHGGKLCNKNTSYYINEHCTLICENAVETLGNLA